MKYPRWVYHKMANIPNRKRRGDFETAPATLWKNYLKQLRWCRRNRRRLRELGLHKVMNKVSRMNKNVVALARMCLNK